MYTCIDLNTVLVDPAKFCVTSKRETYFEHAETAGKDGFPEGRLRRMGPISWKHRLSVWTNFTFWTLLNMLPVMALLLTFAFGYIFLKYFCIVTAPFVIGQAFYYQKRRLYKEGRINSETIAEEQLNSFEWLNALYFSTKVVLPESLRKQTTNQRRIFLLVPHGVYSVHAGYPACTKLLAAKEKLMRMLVAPVLLKMPIVAGRVRAVGGVAAKKAEISKMLDEGHVVQTFLDGVPGMAFGNTPNEEFAYLLKRKQICAIAKSAKAELIPAFVFGGTDVYTPIVDYFGILRKLSILLNVNCVPFIGWANIPFGPPRRVPITVCYGDPVVSDEHETVDEFHARFLNEYKKIFDTHKKSFGWEHKNLVFV